MSRKFELEMSLMMAIEVDDDVIDRVDDEWRSQLYSLHTPEQIAEHLAYNIVVNQATLSWLDGWADLDDDMMKHEIYRDEVTVEAVEWEE